MCINEILWQRIKSIYLLFKFMVNRIPEQYQKTKAKKIKICQTSRKSNVLFQPCQCHIQVAQLYRLFCCNIILSLFSKLALFPLTKSFSPFCIHEDQQHLKRNCARPCLICICATLVLTEYQGTFNATWYHTILTKSNIAVVKLTLITTFSNNNEPLVNLCRIFHVSLYTYKSN